MDLDKVKVSVLLPTGIHQSLKITSIERQTTIQKAMEDAATAWLDKDLGLNTAPESAASKPAPTKQEIRNRMEQLKRILESKDADAILGCTVNLDAMEAFIQRNKGEETMKDDHSIEITGAHSKRRKHGS